MGMLRRMLTEAKIRSAVNAITRDPDPTPDHEYRRSPHSGAGNCECGAAEHHRLHPHDFLPAASDPSRCVCALPKGARVHLLDGGDQS